MVYGADGAVKGVVAGVFGIGSQEMSISPVRVRTTKRSLETGVSSGAPIAFQSGNSSDRPRGSITAPDRMWAR